MFFDWSIQMFCLKGNFAAEKILADYLLGEIELAPYGLKHIVLTLFETARYVGVNSSIILFVKVLRLPFQQAVGTLYYNIRKRGSFRSLLSFLTKAIDWR